MPRRVVVDSGPLIALFDRDDEHHARAVRFLRRFDGVLATNLAVLTEVTHLLDFSSDAQIDFLRWVENGAVHRFDLDADDMRRVVELFEQYRTLPADFADVTLVAYCERAGILEVASVDSDFSIYRWKGKKPFKNVFFAS